MWLVFLALVFTLSPYQLYRSTQLVKKIRDSHPELEALGKDAVLIPQWQEMLVKLIFNPGLTRAENYAEIRRELFSLRILMCLSVISFAGLLMTLPAKIP